MKVIRFITFLITLCLTANVWAYGSGSASKACDKPKFSDFDPPAKSETAPASPFSFTAVSAYPDSIKVTVKKLSVPVVVEDRNGSYRVSGVLPAELLNTYARIDITAKGKQDCFGSDGWLVKIGH
ncbi:MAG: hypothetical protein ACU84J_12610 [Gammaproteobacteria bacterium]